MGSKPITKVGHKNWIRGSILNWFARANSTCNEVLMEKLHAKLGVIADFAALEVGASATAEMAAKGIQQVTIDVR
jgi:hypothetical protein